MKWSPEPIIHLSQNKLVQILYNKIKTFNNTSQIKFNMRVTDVTRDQADGTIKLRIENELISAKYVILSNGANSELRDKLGFKMSGFKFNFQITY